MEGGKKGPLARFKDNEIVRIIQNGGDDIHTDSMGIKSMDLSGNGYGVVIPYRITTPDGTYVIQFTLRSKDSKESRKRRWRVARRPAGAGSWRCRGPTWRRCRWCCRARPR